MSRRFKKEGSNTFRSQSEKAFLLFLGMPSTRKEKEMKRSAQKAEMVHHHHKEEA
jgi:hypothetical protein